MPLQQKQENEKIRVLFINTRSALGADVAVHLSLIKCFNPEHVEVYVATNTHTSHLTETLAHLNHLPQSRVNILDLGREVSLARGGKLGKLIATTRSLFALRNLFPLARLVRQHKIQLVHATDRPRDALFSTLLAQMTKATQIVHCHINWNEHFGKLTRLALQRASAIFAVSEFSRQTFVNHCADCARVYAVLNATDTERFDPNTVPRGNFRRRWEVSANRPVIGIVARVMQWKGHLELIDALHRTVQKIPDVLLAIIGEEDLLAARGQASFAEQVRNRIQELGLERNVLWTGWYAPIEEAIQDIDVLAMPSWEEPFGLAVTEAMAMETPVVANHSGAFPEILTDGEEGILVPPKEPEPFADALVRLLSDPELRRTMGKKGRERVIAHFSPMQQARHVEQIYREVLDA